MLLLCMLMLQERRDYIRSAKELQKMLLMLHTRSRAATSIQAAWKGWKQRQAFKPVWQQHLELKAAMVLQRVSRSMTGLLLLLVCGRTELVYLT